MNMLLMNSINAPLVMGEFICGRIPPFISFTRASTGMRRNSIGLLESIDVNCPRFNYGTTESSLLGLLIEPQKTNYVARSWRLSVWPTNNSAATDNYYVSPDGTQNATRIVSNTTITGKYIAVSGLAANANYAVSGYVKSFSGVSVVRVGTENVAGGVSNGYLHIDTITGEIIFYGSATYDRYSVLLQNGWTYFRYYVTTGPAQTSMAYLAYSIGGGADFSLWGAQIEAGMSATSFIVTDGSIATRAADKISLIVPNGVGILRVIFDDSTIQDVVVTSGSTTMPTDLMRTNIQRLYSL